MIDMEDDIFDEVSEKVYAAFEKKCPDLLIMSEYVKSPSSFPFISIVEICLLYTSPSPRDTR